MKLLDQGNTVGYLVGAALVGLFGWVLTINADVRVIEDSYRTHATRPAHQNTRQDQITAIRGRIDAHENLTVHPPAQTILTNIQTRQAVHSTELEAIQKSLDRILTKLENGPRPR